MLDAQQAIKLWVWMICMLLILLKEKMVKLVLIQRLENKTYCLFGMHLDSRQLCIQIKGKTPSLGVFIQQLLLME